MNTPVSFELAKLLKEKGFNYGFSEGQKFYFPETKELTENHRGNNYPAPTSADVVMWLYEKHGIWIFADYGKKTKSWYYNIQTLATSNHTERILWESGYNSPTEAYEAVITYVLTKLI